MRGSLEHRTLRADSEDGCAHRTETASATAKRAVKGLQPAARREQVKRCGMTPSLKRCCVAMCQHLDSAPCACAFGFPLKNHRLVVVSLEVSSFTSMRLCRSAGSRSKMRTQRSSRSQSSCSSSGQEYEYGKCRCPGDDAEAARSARAIERLKHPVGRPFFTTLHYAVQALRARVWSWRIVKTAERISIRRKRRIKIK